MKTFNKYFLGSAIFTMGALLFAAIVGYFQGGFSMMTSALVSAAVLGVLETSVSLDNAVVNAKYMENLNERSIRWFLTWGMLIAVAGMRLALPILIVRIAGHIRIGPDFQPRAVGADAGEAQCRRHVHIGGKVARSLARRAVEHLQRRREADKRYAALA